MNLVRSRSQCDCALPLHPLTGVTLHDARARPVRQERTSYHDLHLCEKNLASSVRFVQFSQKQPTRRGGVTVVLSRSYIGPEVLAMDVGSRNRTVFRDTIQRAGIPRSSTKLHYLSVPDLPWIRIETNTRVILRIITAARSCNVRKGACPVGARTEVLLRLGRGGHVRLARLVTEVSVVPEVRYSHWYGPSTEPLTTFHTTAIPHVLHWWVDLDDLRSTGDLDSVGKDWHKVACPTEPVVL